MDRNLGTLGAAVSSLDAALRDAHMVQAACHFGTPQYIPTSILVAHRAFQRWCRDHGMTDPATVREGIVQHIRYYRVPVSQSMRYLADCLPNEFNVRGVWTPEKRT